MTKDDATSIIVSRVNTELSIALRECGRLPHIDSDPWNCLRTNVLTLQELGLGGDVAMIFSTTAAALVREEGETALLAATEVGELVLGLLDD